VPSIAGFFCVIAWGRLSDARRDRFGFAAFANALAGLSLLASVLLADPVARVACLTVAFSATLSFTPPFWAITQSFLSGAAAASGIAAVSALGVLGGFVAPTIIGYFANETGDFRFGIGFFACLAMVGALGLFLVGRSAAGAKAALASGAANAAQ
jgi:hypothetical protein